MKTLSTQPARGCPDRTASVFDHHNWLIKSFTSCVQRGGYLGWDTPCLENQELFSHSLGESSDVVNKEMFQLVPKGKDQLVLRPEGTAPIVRALVNEKVLREIPQKIYYHGPMFRYERPQKGRLRQFHQFGLECVGLDIPMNDAEVIHLAWLCLSEVGLKDKTQLILNHLGDSETQEKFKIELLNYLTPLKSSLSEDSQRRLLTNPLRILDSKSQDDQNSLKEAPQIGDCLSSQSKADFDKLQNLLTKLGVSFKVQPQLVRGLDYYTGCVFEFQSEELGAQSAVLSGGRYNNMIQEMGGPDLPAMGWAAGIERLALITTAQKENAVKYAVTWTSETEKQKAFLWASKMREEGQICELFYSGNYSKQIKKAGKFGATKIIYFEENKNPQSHNVIEKDLQEGTQQTVGVI